MKREDELALIDRCFELHAAGATTLESATGRSPVSRYNDSARFDREMACIHRRMPVPWVHSSELAEPNDYRRIITPLGDVIVTRDEDGAAHAFHNVCRHRGSTLVTEAAGNATRLTCPYHAWSYATNGQLLAIPAAQACFPDIDRSERALAEIPTVESLGFIWLVPAAADNAEACGMLNAHLGAMAADLAWLKMEQLSVFQRKTRVWRANWKLLSEGGLETYHFRTAHRDTIGPYFLNNVAVQDRLGIHSRVVMPSGKIERQLELPEEERRLRDFTHILLGLAPQSSFLAQEGHVDWVRMTPLAVDATEIEVTSLVPTGAQGLSEQERKHWQANFDITMTTLDEDFLIGEGIQRGLNSGANKELLFGRNEGLLGGFNAWVKDALADAPAVS